MSVRAAHVARLFQWREDTDASKEHPVSYRKSDCVLKHHAGCMATCRYDVGCRARGCFSLADICRGTSTFENDAFDQSLKGVRPSAHSSLANVPLFGYRSLIRDFIPALLRSPPPLFLVTAEPFECSPSISGSR